MDGNKDIGNVKNVARNDTVNIIDDIPDKADSVKNIENKVKLLQNMSKTVQKMSQGCTQKRSKICEQALFCKAEGDGSEQRAEGKI